MKGNTSRKALEGGDKSRRVRQGERIGYALFGGSKTRDELSVELDMLTQSVCPAIGTLLEERLVYVTDKSRLTKNGKLAEVVALTDSGEDWIISLLDES
jgi:hypothetical protein